MNKEKELILSLLRCNVLKFGNFKLKSGAYTPIYIDLRQIIHYPNVVKELATAMRAKQIENGLKTDTICGVPYTALPIASVFSVLYNVPMVMKRKEAKDYGTKRLLEGNYKTGDSCLIIEDIVASGTSVTETTIALRREGLNVQDCVVVVNKNQGGAENLKKIGVIIHPLLDIDSIFTVHCSINQTEAELVETVTAYFKKKLYLPNYKDESNSTISYAERARHNNHPIAKRLLEIMEEKRSNLCVSVDTNYCHELLHLAEKLGPYICLLKTHIDILNDFFHDFIIELKKLSTMHNFLILEDRKFADSGNIVMQQYRNGLYKIQTWAHLVTVQVIPQTDMLEALKSASKPNKNACVLVTEMSHEGSLVKSNYTEQVFKMAENHLDFVTGYIAQQRHPKCKNLICMYPEFSIAPCEIPDTKYKLIDDAFANGADIITVGKDVCQANDIVASAILYKTRSFNAYLNRISQNKSF